jgi:hypothetical protein
MPLSIGKAASHGCIRMRNHDVEELFNLVEVGDPVELTDVVSPELAKAFAGQEPAKIKPIHADVALAASVGGVQ